MEERKRSKRMASANSRAITKCQLVDECPMFKRKINLTGSKRFTNLLILFKFSIS